jgi:hypothetical protein
MQSQLIVIVVDELRDMKAKIFKVLVFFGVNLLLFQRSKETFAVSVILRSPWPANARYYSMILQRA